MNRTIIAILLFFSVSVLEASGRQYFQSAYRLEKTDPERSLSLYRSALAAGLPADLRKAARWRLFFVARDNGYYRDAYAAMKLIPVTARARSSLYDMVSSRWRLNRSAFHQYYELSTDLKSSSNVKEFIEIVLQSRSVELKKDAEQALKSAGYPEPAFLFERYAGNRKELPERLAEVETLYGQNKLNEAKEKLVSLINEPGALQNNSEKKEALYLLGRIERDRKAPHLAVQYFRLAANYSDSSEGRRLASLAAYSLYKQGYPEEAYSLIRYFPEPSDPGMKLFRLVLLADHKNDRESLIALKEMKDELSRRKSGFLTNKALELIR